MDDGLRMVQSRGCGAWALPGDPTCAGVARRLFRQVVAGLGLEPEAIDDGVTMVSELAANTLHVQQQQQRRSASANPELWMYLRGAGRARSSSARSSTRFPAGRAATCPAAPSPARRPTR